MITTWQDDGEYRSLSFDSYGEEENKHLARLLHAGLDAAGWQVKEHEGIDYLVLTFARRLSGTDVD